MFFDVYLALCESVDKTPNGVAKELGFASASVTQWKHGSTPRPAALQIIADYFKVTVEYLLTGDEGKQNAPTRMDGRELPHADLREVLAGKGVRIMLDADAKLTEAQLEDIVNFIEFQQGKNGK